MRFKSQIPFYRNIPIAFFLFFFFTGNDGFAEGREDSLKHILRQIHYDTLNVETLLQLARNSEAGDLTAAADYYSQTLNYSLEKKERGTVLNSLGMIYLRMGNNTSALQKFREAEDIFAEQNDSTMLGRVYNNMGVAGYWLGNSNQALANYHRALDIRRALNDKKGVSKVFNNIGMIYQDWGLFTDALSWHQQALVAATEAEAPYETAYTYSNIGITYKKLKKFDEALKSYRKGHSYAVMVDEQNRINSYFSSFFGDLYTELGQQDSALHYYEDALDYSKRINNNNRLALANHNLGKIYFTLGEFQLAKEHVNLSYSAAVENNYVSLEPDNLFVLSELAEQEGNTGEALSFLKRATVLRDSLFNADKLSKFNDLQIKYFTEQQNKENLVLKQQNEIQEIAIRQQKVKTRILIISGIFILGILFFIARSRISLKRLSDRLEKSEKELMKVNAGKDKFFALIAHDLKSPFNGLLGVTEILSENFDELPPNQTKKLILELKKSVSNVYALVEGLLSWAQIQTGKIEYRFEKTDLFNLAKEVTEQLETSAKNKNIKLEQNVGENTFAIADEKSVSAVFRNLISNAIKYTNPGGEVKIEAVKKDGFMEISVEDNGTGMSAGKLKRLFKITKIVSEEGTARETGTGLGLILCKEFVEKNSGRIWAQSEPGKGSRFIFTLPAAG